MTIDCHLLDRNPAVDYCFEDLQDGSKPFGNAPLRAGTVLIESVLYLLKNPKYQQAKIEAKLPIRRIYSEHNDENSIVVVLNSQNKFLQLIGELFRNKGYTPICCCGEKGWHHLDQIRSADLTTAYSHLERCGLLKNLNLDGGKQGARTTKFVLTLPSLDRDECIRTYAHRLLALPANISWNQWEVKEQENDNPSSIDESSEHIEAGIPTGSSECDHSSNVSKREPEECESCLAEQSCEEHYVDIMRICADILYYGSLIIPSPDSHLRTAFDDVLLARCKPFGTQQPSSAIDRAPSVPKSMKATLEQDRLNLLLDEAILKEYGDIEIQSPEHLQELRTRMTLKMIDPSLITDTSGTESEIDRGINRDTGTSISNRKDEQVHAERSSNIGITPYGQRILIEPECLRRAVADNPVQKTQLQKV